MNGTMIIVLVVGIAVVVPLGILISWMDSKRYKSTPVQEQEQEQDEDEKDGKKNKKK